MSGAAISVENLSKRYRIGEAEERHETLAGSLAAWAKSPLANFRRLRRLTAFDQESEQDVIWALKDVSFEVQPGEVVGVIGRNGAGKSTLLKILSRITEPTSGRVRIRGRVSSLLEVGTGFHPELTGRENIYLNGTILGMSKREIDRKLDEIVAFSEIERFLDTAVKRYSSGMAVRLAFSVAAHLEPEILLVDEVLAVGDLAFQRKCLGRMGEISEEGRTVLFVSHNMAAIRNLCPRSMLLLNGHLLKDGESDKVIGEYVAGHQDASGTTVLPRPQSDTPAFCSSLTIRNSTGECTSSLLLGEPWSVQVEVEVVKPIPHMIVGLGLRSVEGVPITTYWSRPADARPGQHAVTFSIDLALSSTSLNLIVGLSTNERTFFSDADSAVVTIAEVGEGEQPLRSRQTGILFNRQRPTIEEWFHQE